MSEVSAKSKTSEQSGCDEIPTRNRSNDAVQDGGGTSEKLPVANDVQRAIDGLKDIPDEEFQEFLNDEAFMKDLDVVDSWEGERDVARKDTDDVRTRDRDRPRTSRDRTRRNRKSPHARDISKRDDKRRDFGRRDPFKSSKDIERDKLRTKKDSDNKILAEKEKAIKHLLDSDNVVPPGTEVEVIQDITLKQQKSESGQLSRSRRSRERRRSQDRRGVSPLRRRSNDRSRLSPHRRRSDERRQVRVSPDRRRMGASPGGRRSWERRASRDRSDERHRRREERELRLAARRSRSRDRQRSRSSDRYRNRWSRSPVGRRITPRRRSRSRSRTPDRRARKRSPFINELARTFRNEGLLPGGPSSFLPGIPPLIGQGYGHEQSVPMAPAPMPGFMHHPGPGGPTPMHMQHQPQQQGAPGFMNFEQHGPVGPHMTFEPGRGPPHPIHQTEFAAAPIMYNQGNPPRPMQPLVHVIPGHPMPMQSPQPVPAPLTTELTSIGFNQPNISQQQQRSTIAHNGVHPQRPERLNTPEPPVISNTQQFEKTSLSSLLEASVSAKDNPGAPVLYPGFKPEILRNCELALRDLPSEDLRLKLKGRFFFDPSIEDRHPEPDDVSSNSILLLRAGQNNICWDDEPKSTTGSQSRPIVEMHQKICQTDEAETESRGVQATIVPETADVAVQVSIQECTKKEEKRPIMDRLDWNMRETYDYAPKMREADDLRWSLSNSSQKKAWNRALSPARVIDVEHELSPGRLSTSDHESRGLNAVGSSTRSRDNYPFHRSSSRDRYSRDRYKSPSYRRSLERADEFGSSRSDRSRGESPMVLEDSTDEVEIPREQHFSRGSDWRTRGKTSYRARASSKIRTVRGNPAAARSYTGRGGFHGQF